MVYSVSDAVRELLGELTFLRAAVDYDLLNYSAVARFLQPVISSKIGGEASEEAIAIAVRRYVEASKGAQLKQSRLLDAVRGAKITLRTDMCMLEVAQWQESNFLDKMRSIFSEVDFKAGEKFYVITRSTTLFLICNSRFLPVIESSILLPARISWKEQNLSIITINVQFTNFDIPGILQFFTQQFEMAGINIIDVFTTRGKMSFIFHQKDAARAYERVSAAIEAIKSMPLGSAARF